VPLLLLGLAAGEPVGPTMSVGESVGPSSPPSGVGLSTGASVGEPPFAGSSVPPPLAGAEGLPFAGADDPDPSLGMDDGIGTGDAFGLRDPFCSTGAEVPLLLSGLAAGEPVGPTMSVGESVGPSSPPSGVGLSTGASVGEPPFAGSSVPPPLAGAEGLPFAGADEPDPSLGLDDGIGTGDASGLRDPFCSTGAEVPLVLSGLAAGEPVGPTMSVGGSVGPPSPPSGVGLSAGASVGEPAFEG
jgi:hypothetical protein